MIILEVRDRRLNLLARQRVERFPVRIGRAYDNDVILDDRHVDAHHAMLYLADDGVVVVEDLGSVNGVRDGLRGASSPRLRLASGGSVRLGETVLRVLDAGHAVARAVPLAHESQLARLVRTRSAAWLAIGGSMLLSMLMASFRLYDGESAVAAVSAAFLVLALLSVWAGIWAIVGRAQGGRAGFLTHLAIASTATAIGTLWVAAAGYLEFLWPDFPVRSFIESAGTCAIFVAALSAHLSLVSTMSRQRRLLASSLVTLGLIGLVAVGELSDSSDFDNGLHYSDELRPLGQGLAHTVTL
ncbi:MAG TPA: FHA domain-containing protein, partial [Gemmatimonadales bacterium]|nr:FHA domain-containing protein [Gemmatimonadales bacterium]